MTTLRILQYPDPGLKRQAKLVVDVNAAHIQRVIDDMLETLHNTDHCAGLSATQLDMIDPPRITVLDSSLGEGEPMVLVNPQIIHREGEVAMVEGCMSIYPDKISAEVKRSEFVTVQVLDRDGKEFEIKADDFLAVCLQHELDHLNGVVYLDHLSTLKRRLIDKKIRKLINKLGS